jgi:flagellar basal-body rod protein FlgB
MFLNGDSYIAPISNMLSAISQRQKINSANVANAQTPGYIARSASFSDLLQENNPFETPLSQKMGSHLEEIDQETGAPVDLQKELVEMQKNGLFYSMATRRASTIFTALKTASQVGR